MNNQEGMSDLVGKPVTHDDILQEFVRHLEETAAECADGAAIYLLDGRSVTAALRAIVDRVPRFDLDDGVVRKRIAAALSGAAVDVRAVAIGWGPKPGGAK